MRERRDAPVAVTDAFRMTKSVNLISESDMTDGSAFFNRICKYTLKITSVTTWEYLCACRIQATIRKGNRRKTTIFSLNLMSDIPKKPGKKSGRKAKQREASDFCQICRVNVKLNVAVYGKFRRCNVRPQLSRTNSCLERTTRQS